MALPDIVDVLEIDPDLANGLSAAERAAATEALTAPAIGVAPGAWNPASLYPGGPPAIGLLVLDGLLTRQVTVADRVSTELLGPGDLLRPWDQDGDLGLVTIAVEWHVLAPTRVVVLDQAVHAALLRWPPLLESLLCRALRRARWLAFQLGVRQITRIEGRLLVLLWALSERWGRVTPRGVEIQLRLTHEQLGRLVGARRPSVTTALGALSSAGFVERVPGGFLLRGAADEAMRHAAREAPAASETHQAA